MYDNLLKALCTQAENKRHRTLLKYILICLLPTCVQPRELRISLVHRTDKENLTTLRSRLFLCFFFFFYENIFKKLRYYPKNKKAGKCNNSSAMVVLRVGHLGGRCVSKCCEVLFMMKTVINNIVNLEFGVIFSATAQFKI